MGEVDRLVTQTALAIRDADELEVAASVLDAALRRAKAEGVRMAAELVRDDCYIDGGELLPDYEHRCKHNVSQKELAAKLDARAAQIEEGTHDKA